MADECSVLTCANVASWRVELRIWPRGVEKSSVAPAEMKMGLALCGPCTFNRSAENFISNESWARIEKAFAAAGKLPPERATVELSLVRIK